MGLKKVYFDKVKELGLQPDELQIEAIKELQEIIEQLNLKKISKFSLFNKSIYPQIKGQIGRASCRERV